MNESLLLSLLIFAGLLLVVFSLYLVLKAMGEKRRIVEKIEKEGASESPGVSTGDAAEPAGAFKQSFVDLTTRLGTVLGAERRRGAYPSKEEADRGGLPQSPMPPSSSTGSRSCWPSRCRRLFSSR